MSFIWQAGTQVKNGGKSVVVVRKSTARFMIGKTHVADGDIPQMHRGIKSGKKTGQSYFLRMETAGGGSLQT